MTSVIAKQKLFPTVQDTDSILTEEWLEAAKDATVIIESMGSNFSMTKDDMVKNIQKIRTKYETDKERLKKFKDILKDELEKKEDKKDGSATVGGLWLKRGLEYLCEVFWGIKQEHEKSCQSGDNSGDGGEIKRACQCAYDLTLKSYHNFVVKGIVKGALMWSPTKEKLFSNLTGGVTGKDMEVVQEITAYEKAMRQYVYMLGQLFKEFGNTDAGIRQNPEDCPQQSS